MSRYRHKIIILQAANTGLTGGSTPDGDNYDRDIIIINTLKIDQLLLLLIVTLHKLN